jgi:hypothetical protein
VANDADGTTFALEAASRQRLTREAPGVRHAPRIYVAHETEADFASLVTEMQPQIVTLLTGLSPERAAELGGVIFRDASSDRELGRSTAVPRRRRAR